MVVGSDGYAALLEYFVKNMALFSANDDRIGSETIEELVHELVASQIMTLCDQNKHIPASLRFSVMNDADQVVIDVEEMLKLNWKEKPSVKQINFLSEYVELLKNLFDADITEAMRLAN